MSQDLLGQSRSWDPAHSTVILVLGDVCAGLGADTAREHQQHPPHLIPCSSGLLLLQEHGQLRLEMCFCSLANARIGHFHLQFGKNCVCFPLLYSSFQVMPLGEPGCMV